MQGCPGMHKCTLSHNKNICPLQKIKMSQVLSFMCRWVAGFVTNSIITNEKSGSKLAKCINSRPSAEIPIILQLELSKVKLY